MKDEIQDVPEVIAPPPLIYLTLLIVGLLLHWALPISFPPIPSQLVLGLPMISIGIFVLAWTIRTLHTADTGLTFSEPTKALVAQGPFGFSRNPIYLSFALIYLGIAISLNALWPMLLFLLVLLVIQRGVIDCEERYLERRFGEEYLRYKSMVRRWL